MKIPRQCEILVGGLGTRLGSLAAGTPKPLLDCGGRPFLAWVLRELSRFGITNVVLLAGYKSERVEEFCRDMHTWLPKPLSIRISVEPSPAGTGGAVWHARHLLEDAFLLINGDSWIDVNLARFFAQAAAAKDMTGSMLLRSMADCSRYGRVELEGDRVVALHEKSALAGPGVINGGLYILDRSVLERAAPVCSLEREVLPTLAREGRLSGCVLDGYFIDIGVPSDYARAGVELPQRLLRPAIVFEARVLLDEEDSKTEGKNPIRWKPGAVESVRTANDAGVHVFVMAAPDHFAAEGDRQDLLGCGATVDDAGQLDQSGARPRTEDANEVFLRRLLARWEVASSRSVVVTAQDAGGGPALVEDRQRPKTGASLPRLVRTLTEKLQAESSTSR